MVINLWQGYAALHPPQGRQTDPLPVLEPKIMDPKINLKDKRMSSKDWSLQLAGSKETHVLTPVYPS